MVKNNIHEFYLKNKELLGLPTEDERTLEESAYNYTLFEKGAIYVKTRGTFFSPSACVPADSARTWVEFEIV